MVAGILITTDPQKTTQVYHQIKALEGVGNITAVFGRFDLVVMIRALDEDAASKLLARIRSIEGIRSTETLIATTLE
jgi:nitrate reductase NapAB chaperone NapD